MEARREKVGTMSRKDEGKERVKKKKKILCGGARH